MGGRTLPGTIAGPLKSDTPSAGPTVEEIGVETGASRSLVVFCVIELQQTQEYHVFNVHDGGLFPLSTALTVG